MTADLAALAERRAGLSALLGLLLLEEPGPELRPYVDRHAALAPLACGDAALPSEYERVFLRGVPLYESVFRSDGGQHGGERLGEVLAAYDRCGFSEHDQRRWRIAGADHLGMELRCYAHLCHGEAVAWRQATADAAVEAVEAERAFLADHLATWGQVAALAGGEVAGEGPYAEVFSAVDAFLGEENARLRPAPALGAALDAPGLPTRFGAARLARLLLAPATSGAWLGVGVISAAAARIGSPWRPSDTRSSLAHLLHAAEETGDLAQVVAPVADALDDAAAAYAARATSEPGNAATWQLWQARAEAMAALVRQVAARRQLGQARSTHRETIVVEGGDEAGLMDAVDEALAQLRAAGFSAHRLTGG